MQLAILIGANPKTAASSARVRLRRGSWSLMFDGLDDSVFLVHTLTPRSAPDSDTHIQYEVAKHSSDLVLPIDHPTMVYLEWKHRGTEKAISVSAHIDKGT